MKIAFSSILSLLLSFCVLAAPQRKATRVDFTSSPDGALVVIDGDMRGTTPLTVYDLQPGPHHIRFSLRDYETHTDIFALEEGIPYIVKHAELSPVKGLLLLTSDPSECAISLDGISYGQTPRLVTDLDAKGTYRFLLQKPGYQPRTVEVKFNGRTPLAKHEQLILDSGILRVGTEPGGASVIVNGIERGKTPMEIKDVPKGRVSISLSLAGYKTEVRELNLNAGESQELSVQLEELPSTLVLTSVPEGARFYVNGEAHGKGPVTLSNLKRGKYKVIAKLDGHADVERDIEVGLAQRVSQEFTMENIRGKLEIRTIPAGAQVILDGHPAGVTKGNEESTAPSEIFLVPDLLSGEHSIVIKKDGFADVVRHPVIETGKTAQVNVRLKRVFKPNVEVVTSSGTYRGVFVDNNAEAITIEISMGITRSFPAEDVKNVNFLDAE